jgi:hypothetical protein
MSRNIETEQRSICKKYGAEYMAVTDKMKLGIAVNAREGIQPINGLRHAPEGDTSGWYIWAGNELVQDPDFFKPLHVAHLDQWCPQVRKYLGLAPGWRFLIADGYEDVWFDATLLTI